MIRHCKLMVSAILGTLLIFSVGFCRAENCGVDFKAINYYAVGSYTWSHSIQAECNASTAEIELLIKVWTFNDWGVLDLFCSNTTTFDYGSATTATSKPGHIRRITRTDAPDSGTFYTISATLNSTQRSWLNDDGTIYVALIGPAYTSFPAQFDLTSSTLDTGQATPSAISLSSGSLSNISPLGSNAPNQSFDIWNSGGGTLSYSISDDATWLSCLPVNGSSTGEHDTIIVNYETASLAEGDYSAIITIENPMASNSPQTIAVSLTVAILYPDISISPLSFQVMDFSGPFDSPGSAARGLAFDGTYLWNADSTSDKIYKLDMSGNIIDSFDSPGPFSRGLVFDGTYLWNADSTSDKIYKLDMSGNIIDSFDSPGTSPDGLAFDGTYLWNADSLNDKIYKLDTLGNIIDSFNSPGTYPSGLTFDGTYLWNTDYTDDKLYKLDMSGSIIDSVDSPGASPSGLTFDGTYLWHADHYYDEIHKLDISGKTIDYFDSPGAYPSDLAFDGDYLWNSDSRDDKIYKLDILGNIVGSFDTPGATPTGLAFDGTYLWHADSTEDKIYKLDTGGNIVASFDSPGNYPSGLAFDGTYLWHADSYYDKIYKLNMSGDIIDSFNSPGPVPSGLTFDGLYLWITDSSTDKIYKLDTSGNIIATFDSFGSNPMGLAFDGMSLWGSDSSSDKIRKFYNTPGPVEIGFSKTRSFTIMNSGDANLDIETLSISGTDVSEFDIENDLCTGQTLGIAGTCTVDITFSPLSSGEKTANLEIPSNDPDTPTLVVPLDSTTLAFNPDFNKDGDVDGSDLSEFIVNFDAEFMAAFATGFGR